MTALSVPLPYPLRAEDEQRAINRLAFLVAMARHSAKSNEWLSDLLRQALRAGHFSISKKAVEAADQKRDEIADAALREVGAELLTDLLQKRDLAPGHLQVVAYYQRVADRAPLKRKPGRYGTYDRWRRNLTICAHVRLACDQLGVDPTRNLQSHRANREPSGISLTVAAYARNKIHLAEATVQTDIWFGVWGEIVRAMPGPFFVDEAKGEYDQ